MKSIRLLLAAFSEHFPGYGKFYLLNQHLSSVWRIKFLLVVANDPAGRMKQRTQFLGTLPSCGIWLLGDEGCHAFCRFLPCA